MVVGGEGFVEIRGVMCGTVCVTRSMRCDERVSRVDLSSDNPFSLLIHYALLNPLLVIDAGVRVFHWCY
jgi:hypothetical protein